MQVESYEIFDIMKKRYINVLVNIKADYADRLFTYESGFEKVEVGERIFVPFGKRDAGRTGYVMSVFEAEEEDINIENLKLADEKENILKLSEESLETAKWMQQLYVCRLIDCVKMFVPSYVKARTKSDDSTFKNSLFNREDTKQLNSEQEAVLNEITNNAGKYLLKGVTGSGKTEIYIALAQQCIERQKTAIILVPEISLTGQMISRFVARFGEDRIALLHSRMKDSEKKEYWHKIYKGEVDIVIGARSAIFVPAQNIGLIMVDEVHDESYKSEQQPKYDAISIANKRAELSNATLVLGSATPTIVDYNSAIEGKYKLLELTRRYNDSPLPAIKVVDMREELLNGNVGTISCELEAAVRRCIEEKRQIILFINRRGYAKTILCRNCGHVLKCESCDIPMTYHKETNILLCHQCGNRQERPAECPNCGEQRKIREFRPGTEQVEEEVKRKFPELRISRLDSDKIAQGTDAAKLIEEFRMNRIDILIGTKMIAKGLDFKNVGLVGIVAIDYELNYPDYRSSERAYTSIVQAAGRAGRAGGSSEVIIQTYSPENDVIKMAKDYDYNSFFKSEVNIRRIFGYPPYSDIIKLDILGRNLLHIDSVHREIIKRLSPVISDEGFIGEGRSTAERKGDESSSQIRKRIMIKFAHERRTEVLSKLSEIRKNLIDSHMNVRFILDMDRN